eukprot:CAMPEP_0182443262 /NCGR_PEP_ID=MMETSP1172-20130603/2033_1 /TAXON_ID=708627 /ORGANISM="Timspurckia oligopyrenoides, Strain CCMP3278" /LENGTH=953 /DNA_ID=CAMNT_0024638469 /DNA_START=140 /DNA_END=2998 /DNA_ORIENTATION=-
MASESTAPHLADFKALIDGPLSEYCTASTKLGGCVLTQSELVKSAFSASYTFLLTAAQQSKPSDEALQTMVTPIGELMGQIQGIAADTPPRDPLFNHVSAWSESIAALGWVMVDSKAVSYISDFEGAGEFYTSKVLMTYKKADNAADHQQWVKAVKQIFADLKAFVKAHHTQKLEWNKGLTGGAAADDEDEEDEDGDDEGSSADPVSAFDALVSGPVAAYLEASKAIGGCVESQAADYVEGWKKEAEFIKKAASMPKPDDVQSLVGDIAAEMGKVGEYGGSVPPRDDLFNHVSAISESVSALGWVVLDSKPVPYITDAEGAGEFYLSKVLMKYKKADDGEKHVKWVTSVKEMYAGLKAYVKEYFTTSLTWNFGAAGAKKPKKTKKKAVDDDEDDSSGPDPVAAFQEIIDVQLAAYIDLSKKIGGEVATQADSFAAGWKHELEFLKKAAKMPKPDDVQSMVGDIAGEMGKVGEIASGVPPRETLFNHVTAIGESVGVLGWVVLDSKPVPYIGDMEGAGEFYLSKVLMTFKKADDAAVHQEWVKSVKDLYSALKAFVKEYFSTSLTWNFEANKPKKSSGGKKTAKKSAASGGSSSLSEFKAILDGVVAEYASLSKTIGGPVLDQSNSLVSAFTQEYEFLVKAAGMPKPASQDDIMAMLTPIGTEIGKAQEIQNSVAPRDPFVNHLTAIGETIPALSWVVVESKPVGFVGDMEGAGDFYLNKVLVDYKKSDDCKTHQEWVRSTRAIFAELKKFVKAHHTTGLMWNTGTGGGAAEADEDDEDDTASGGNVISDFEDLMKGSVATYVDISKKIGGLVEKQALAVLEVYEKELAFLKEASSMSKPSDDVFQTMVTPVGAAMGAVNDVKDSAPPRDEFENHLTAMAESIPALGWVGVDSKPVSFVGDMAGAGEFYLNKVLTQFKGTDSAALHRDWVASVKAMYDDLKAYIKQWHTTKLSW